MSEPDVSAGLGSFSETLFRWNADFKPWWVAYG